MRKWIIFIFFQFFSLLFSNSISILFDKEIKGKGIKFWTGPQSGGESIKVYGGKTGLETNLSSSSNVIYFDLDDNFIHGEKCKVLIKIEYWDKESEKEKGFEIAYDSTGDPNTKLPKVYFGGTNTWKKIIYFVDNAYFSGRQKSGADLKIYSAETDFCIRSIEIEKVPDRVPLSKIEIVPSYLEIFEGEIKNLICVFTPFYSTEKFVNWSTSNPKIVNIKEIGHICQISAISVGECIIKAKSLDGKLTAECKVKVIPVSGKGEIPKKVSDFLDSIGVNSSISIRGENLDKTIECVKYLGIRWIRSGIGLKMDDYIKLHKETGVKFSLGLNHQFNKLLEVGREMAEKGMLLSFEGPNEPNNWGFPYLGEEGGGRKGLSWIPIAKFQRDGYNFIKSDPILKNYPVWHLSESGAEVDNVGVQFLQIPKGAGALMEEGTIYADYANCHNYACHPTLPPLIDNQAWYAADPVIDKVPGYNGLFDGLYGTYGRTWLKKYKGYDEDKLIILPRVTTETGITIDENKGITEEIQGTLYLHIYLSQFKRGWSYTAIYLLRDRIDESGNQTFGFFRPDYTPRKSAIYLHNLTTILKDEGKIKKLGRLEYEIKGKNEEVHDLLLQKSDGSFYLIIWNERLGTKKVDKVDVIFGKVFDKIEIYDVKNGVEPVKIIKNSKEVSLSLNNNVFIISVK